MFRKLDQLPVPLEHLKDTCTAKEFEENKASWHKSCHRKFDQDKLERVRKRVSNEYNVKRICLQRQSLEFLVKKKLVTFMNSKHVMLTSISETWLRFGRYCSASKN